MLDITRILVLCNPCFALQSPESIKSASSNLSPPFVAADAVFDESSWPMGLLNVEMWQESVQSRAQ